MTTLFGNVEPAEIPVIEVALASPKKHGWLPLLIVLFLLSYGLMTMLIVEQGRTIDSQRGLIQELFQDSNKVAAVRQHAPNQHGMAQAPAAQNPSTQAPMRQAPSSQADPQIRSENGAGKQKPFHMPTRPAADLADRARALITI